MREISAFDVIGPIMVGPSSSHTAGALKIAKIASKLTREKITSVKFRLYGSFAKTYGGHGTDRALLAGILGMDTDDPNIRNSFEIARERGVEFSFETDPGETEFHPNTVEITVGYDGGELFLRGSSIGGGEVEITNINGTDISFSGRYNAVLIYQKDVPGVVAFVSKVFEKHGINIAFMQVYRDGDRAYSIVEIDGTPSDEFIAEMEKMPAIISVRYFHIAG